MNDTLLTTILLVVVVVINITYMEEPTFFVALFVIGGQQVFHDVVFGLG